MSHAYDTTTDVQHASENRPRKTGLDQGAPRWVDSHLDLILELPEPGQDWLSKDFVESPEQFRSVRDDIQYDIIHRLAKMQRVGVIRKVQVVDEKNGTHSWRTDRQVYRYAERARDELNSLPCGHVSGFRTITAGEEYECGYRYCEEQYPREVIAEVRL